MRVIHDCRGWAATTGAAGRIALVQVGGCDAITEDFLLAVLPAFRPITAQEIAAVG